MAVSSFPAEARPVPLRVAILLFVLVWMTYGAAIKKRELKAYNLQQMGIDALVEHDTLEVGKSEHPQLQPRGDVFRFEGRLYPAKQPGQFVFGALAYKLLRWFGMSYERDYITTAAWVTWLSASSFAALSPTLLLVLLVRLWGLGMGPSLAAALVLAFGTPLFAYSGVAHHDVISSGLLLAAFVALQEAWKGGSSLFWVAFGITCGLVLFVSMLPALMVMVLLAASLVKGNVRRMGLVGFGFFIGMLPLAVMNLTYFHSPVVQPYMAGGYTDGLFHPSWERLRSMGWDYLGLGRVSVWLYAPAAGAGLLSLVLSAWRNPRCRRSVGVILTMVVMHLAYILNIHTLGDCQFGPRYLMPCLAFAVAGCALQWNRAVQPGSSRADRALGFLLVVVALASIGIGVAGARIGTMICDLSTWAPARALPAPWRLQQYPLALPMATMFSALVIGGLVLRLASKRTHPPSPST